jgi:hypothetical protein
MHKNATKCNKTLSKWYINKHGASKIIDTFETYQQGAGTESSVPRNWSSTAAVLRNFYWENADCFRVFRQKALYRRRGGVQKWTRGLTPGWHCEGLARAALACGKVLAPLRLCFEHRLMFWKNRRFGFCFVQFREYVMCSFSKHKNSRKQGTGTVASDAARMTTQLGTPRGRYDEHSSKFSLSKKLRFIDPVGKRQT